MGDTFFLSEILQFFHQYGALGIFFLVMIGLITEFVEHAVTASIGAILMILFGMVTPTQALEAIAFPTLVLIMSMMIFVSILEKTGLFTIISVKISRMTGGNPLLIFLFFTSATVLFSSILGGVATIVIILPIVLVLLKQMNIDPLPYIIGIIMSTNIGASITVIGDATNSLIAGETGFGFNSFIMTMTAPALIMFVVSIGLLLCVFRKTLKPINYSFLKLTMAHLTIKKIIHDFAAVHINKTSLVLGSILLICTIGAFLTSDLTGIHPSMIATIAVLIGLVLLVRHEEFRIHINAVDRGTLVFFTALFIMVAGIENTHIFDIIPQMLLTYAGGNFFLLVASIIRSIALVSMFFDNIPFILLMIPIVASIEIQMKTAGTDLDTSLLWRAISIGGIYGGNGTIIAGVQNIIGIGIAAQYGYKVSFMRYFVYAFPITILSLACVTWYLYYRI